MNEYTPEQLRKIDAAVAECMGYEWKVSPAVNLIMLLPASDDRFVRWERATGTEQRGADWDSYVLHYTAYYKDWGQVEKWMVENFTNFQQVNYPGYVRELLEHNNTGFEILTAPLSVRCIAFLRTMRVDVQKVLA